MLDTLVRGPAETITPPIVVSADELAVIETIRALRRRDGCAAIVVLKVERLRVGIASCEQIRWRDKT